MTGTIESTTGRPRRARQALALAALGAMLVGLSVVSLAGARDAKVLGKTKHTPNPDCPTDTQRHPCEGVGSVTGFPLVAGGEKRPMKVPENGKLVAWAIDLSRPKKSQRDFFGDLFKSEKLGKKPTARIAVIKHMKRHDYKLLRQSPVVNLSGALGRKQLFTLDKPLRIRKGQVVALTVPTWASNFASHIHRNKNRWRASRSRRNCAPSSGDEIDVQAIRAQEQAPAEGRLGARLRLRLHRGATPVLGLLRPRLTRPADRPRSPPGAQQASGCLSQRRSNRSAGLPGGGGMSLCAVSSPDDPPPPVEPLVPPPALVPPVPLPPLVEVSWCSQSWWTTSSWWSSEGLSRALRRGRAGGRRGGGLRSVVVPAAAGQRQSHRQRQGGERCERPAHEPPSSAGWRSPQ